MSDEYNPKEQWHLDKRVPVALIVTILTGYAGGIWWVSDLSHKVDNNTKDIVKMENAISERAAQNTDASNRIIRIEEKLANQTDILREIKEAVSGLRATKQELDAR